VKRARQRDFLWRFVTTRFVRRTRMVLFVATQTG